MALASVSLWPRVSSESICEYSRIYLSILRLFSLNLSSETSSIWYVCDITFPPVLMRSDFCLVQRNKILSERSILIILDSPQPVPVMLRRIPFSLFSPSFSYRGCFLSYRTIIQDFILAFLEHWIRLVIKITSSACSSVTFQLFCTINNFNNWLLWDLDLWQPRSFCVWILVGSIQAFRHLCLGVLCLFLLKPKVIHYFRRRLSRRWL